MGSAPCRWEAPTGQGRDRGRRPRHGRPPDRRDASRRVLSLCGSTNVRGADGGVWGSWPCKRFRRMQPRGFSSAARSSGRPSRSHQPWRHFPASSIADQEIYQTEATLGPESRVDGRVSRRNLVRIGGRGGCRRARNAARGVFERGRPLRPSGAPRGDSGASPGGRDGWGHGVAWHRRVRLLGAAPHNPISGHGHRVATGGRGDRHARARRRLCVGGEVPGARCSCHARVGAHRAP